MFLCDTLEGSHPRANVNGSPEFQGGYSQQTLAMATNRKAKARTNFGETRINSRSSRAFCWAIGHLVCLLGLFSVVLAL